MKYLQKGKKLLLEDVLLSGINFAVVYNFRAREYHSVQVSSQHLNQSDSYLGERPRERMRWRNQMAVRDALLVLEKVCGNMPIFYLIS